MQENLCDKVLQKYEPNGLIDEIPPNWNCPMDGKSFLVNTDSSFLPIPVVIFWQYE